MWRNCGVNAIGHPQIGSTIKFIKNFNRFIIRLDRKPKSWEDRLLLFVGYLIENKKQSSTVKSYISAIKSVLRKDGVHLNLNKLLLNSLTKACRLQNNRVRTKLPICKGLMELLAKSVPKMYRSEQPYLILLFQTTIATAYFGLFRIGEITLSDHVMKAADVHIGENKDKVMILLCTSKTHGKGDKPQIIKIESTGDNNNYHFADPFRLLQRYTAIRRKFIHHSEQFFIYRDWSPVTPQQFCAILKKLLAINGLNPSLYSSQGIHAGRATDLAEVYHLSIEMIRKLGRWKSSAIYTYLRA